MVCSYVALKSCDRVQASCMPGVGKGGQPRSGLSGTLRLIDDTCLLKKLLSYLLVGIVFEALTELVGNIAQLIEDAALFDHVGSIHEGQGFAEFNFHCLQFILRPEPPFP